MKEFDEFEIERSGQEGLESRSGMCPVLREPCIADRCMWWVRDWSEDRRKFQHNCAVSLIAIGLNDEALRRAEKNDD